MKFKKNFLKLQNTYLKVNFERTVNVTNLFLKLNPKKEYSTYLLLHSKPHQSLGAKNIKYIYFAQRSAISLGLDSVGSPLFYLVSSGTAQRQGSWNPWRLTCSVICLAVDVADCLNNYKSSFHMAWTSLQLGSWVPRVAFQKGEIQVEAHCLLWSSLGCHAASFPLHLYLQRHSQKEFTQVQKRETDSPSFDGGVSKCWTFLCS